jgi:transcriptional regulator with XRE-family HTH domain
MALNPHILVWAREAAGLSVDEAAHALGFKNTQERTAAERLQAIELGTEEPSRSVLLNMARVYHRSLLVFLSQRAAAYRRSGPGLSEDSRCQPHRVRSYARRPDP